MEITEKIQNKAINRIRSLYKRWFIHEPLMYAVVVYHKLVPNEEISSIRVNSGKLEFNSRFIDEMSDYRLNEVLMFEAYRILLKHPYQRAKANKSVNYFSSSITINELFDHTLHVVRLEDFGFESKGHEKKYHEYYYDLITTKRERIEDDFNGTHNAGGFGIEGEGEEQADKDDSADGVSDELSESGSPDTQNDSFEDGEESSSDSLEEDRSLDPVEEEDSYLTKGETAFENAEEWSNQENHAEAINKRIEEADKNEQWGSIPGDIQATILKSLKPRVDYRTILKKFKAKISSFDQQVTTIRKFNRRLGFPYSGKTAKPKTKIGICLDVSGSISEESLERAFSVIKRLFSYGVKKVEVIQFDVTVKRDLICKLHKAQTKNMISGREGTDLSELLEYMEERKDIDNFLVFTDGFFDRNLRLPKKKSICFLLENEETYNDFAYSNLGKAAMYTTYIQSSC